MPVNVVVCVKQIPDPNAPGKLDPASKRLVRDGVDLVLDPGDEHAVEAALQVAEAAGGEVTVVSMGPPRAGDAIRRALSMGGARGVHVQDPGLQNSDTLSTARVLAAAIKGQPFDLIVCGQESTDGSTGAVPGQLAELLGLPLLSFAKQLTVEQGKASVHRQTDEGYDVVEAPLPAVVTVTGGINEPRYPSLRGIMQSKNKEVKQLDLNGLGLEGQAGGKALTQEVVDLQPAASRKAGRVIEDKGEAVKEIVDFLAELKVI
jgi:electron transfer flavoprotein beta subunit